MNWRICSFLGATLLLLWAAPAVAGAATPERAASRARTIVALPKFPSPRRIRTRKQRPSSAASCFSIPSSPVRGDVPARLAITPVYHGETDCRGRSEKAKQVLALRAPTLIDIAWIPRLGWDGKFRDLESVAFGPITSPANMNLPESSLIARLSSVSGYVDDFTAAFGEGPITRENIELALATFERSIVSEQAPFDRWIAGDEAAIDAAAKRGFDIFSGKGRCAECHSKFAFTDGSFRTTSGRPAMETWDVAGFFRIR